MALRLQGGIFLLATLLGSLPLFLFGQVIAALIYPPKLERGARDEREECQTRDLGTL